MPAGRARGRAGSAASRVNLLWAQHSTVERCMSGPRNLKLYLELARRQIRAVSSITISPRAGFTRLPLNNNMRCVMNPRTPPGAERVDEVPDRLRLRFSVTDQDARDDNATRTGYPTGYVGPYALASLAGCHPSHEACVWRCQCTVLCSIL